MKIILYALLLLLLPIFALAQNVKEYYLQRQQDQKLDAKITDSLRNSYLYLGNYHQGRARFHHKNCYWGYLDEHQKEIKGLRFDWAGDFNGPFAQVDLKRGEAVINRNLELVSEIGSYVSWEQQTDSIYLIRSYTPDRKALVNVHGDRLTNFQAQYLTRVNDTLWIVEQGIRHGFFHTPSKHLTGLDFVELSRGKSDQYFAAAKRRSRFGIVNTQGQVIVPFQYKSTYPLGEQPLFAVQDPKTERWGLVNAQNQQVLPFRYYQADLYALALSPDIIAITEEEGWAVYDYSGVKLATYPEEAEIFQFSPKTIAIHTYGEGYLLDQDGQLASDRFSSYDYLAPGYYRVYRDNQRGIFKADGRPLIPIRYKSIEYLGGSAFLAHHQDGMDFYAQDSLLFQNLDSSSWGPMRELYLYKDKQQLLWNIEKDELLANWSEDYRHYFPELQIFLCSTEAAYYLEDPNQKRLFPQAFDQWAIVKSEIGELPAGLALRAGQNWFYLNHKLELSTALAAQPITHYSTTEGDFLKLELQQADTLRYGLAREQGKLLLKPLYASIQSIGKGYFKLEETTSWEFQQIINPKGKMILRVKNQTDFQMADQRIISRNKSSYTYNLYNLNAQAIEVPQNGQITNIDANLGLVIIRVEEYYGLMDFDGKTILPTEYDHLSFEDAGLIEANKGIHRWWFDKKGEFVECYRRRAIAPLRIFD